MMNALRSLRWYEWLWCALPLGLLATGDWFGVLCGLAGFAYNLRAFTSASTTAQPPRLKYMVTLLATITVISLYLIAGLIFVALLTPL